MKATTKIGNYDIEFYTDGNIITKVLVKVDEEWVDFLECITLEELDELDEDIISEML